MEQTLNTLLKDNEWFAGVEKDNFGRLIVYVSEMSVDILKTIPEKINNVDILIHFACSKKDNKENYVNVENFDCLKPLSSEELKKIKLSSKKEILEAFAKGKKDRDDAIRYSPSLNLSNIFFK